jgi:hypothetical protein
VDFKGFKKILCETLRPLFSALKLYNGAPTAISHRCPGSPCFGLSLGEPADFNIGVAAAAEPVFIVGVAAAEPVFIDGVAAAGAEFNGAPTAISHRCPGSPCFGLSLAVAPETDCCGKFIEGTATAGCVVLITGVVLAAG